MKKEWLSWDQFESYVQILVKQIRLLVAEGKVTDLYGIPRGGMIVAVRLSYILDIPLVESAAQVSETTLIVDDVLGSGKTIRRVLHKVSSRQFAVLLYSEDTKLPSELNVFVRGCKMPGDVFIKLPWAPEDEIH